MKTQLAATLAVCATLLGGAAYGQTAPPGSTTAAPPIAARAAPGETRPWSGSLLATAYFLPEGRDYVQPTVNADHGRLHLEARYNYESLDAGSIWAGYNFGGGETVEWILTPMVGGVFGKTSAVAPGYKAWVAWRWLEVSSEGELVFDADDSSESFFYNWSEVALAPVDWFRVGLVTQRTRAYQSARDLQRGLLVGTSYRGVDFTTYILNPDDPKPTVVLTLGLRF